MPHRTRSLVALCAVAGVAILTAGCGDGDDESSGATTPAGKAQLSIGTTVAPITSIAANIGGDLVKITGIVPEGTNSHTFEPKPSVAELLSTIDVLFINGLKLEEPTRELAEANLKSGAEIVEIGTKSIPESQYAYDFSFPKSGGKPNPHLWTDPKYALKYAGDHPRRARQARQRRRGLLQGQLRQVQGQGRRVRQGDADLVRHDPASQAQAADLPRRVRLLRPRLRLGHHRRDPGLGLRGPDAEGGRRPDRPGQGDERARHLRLRGLPQPRARADRQGGGRQVRRRPARRRPPGRAGRGRALLDGPHALRLRDDDRGDGWRRHGSEGVQARRRRAGQGASTRSDHRRP